MKEWAIDLHLHTPLSPCGQDSMLPEKVVQRAVDLGLDVIAIPRRKSIWSVCLRAWRIWPPGMSPWSPK